jgi:hypothetical protein
MCEVRFRKNGQEQNKKRKKSTVVGSKKKWTAMNPIRRRLKKRNPSSGQNGQLVHWWLLVHSGPPTLGRAFHKLKHPQYHARGPAPKISTFIRNNFFLPESEDINLSKECEGMSREVSGHNV